ncbi:MAG: SIS domain-containing protein [Desulfobacterales bacterium]
MIPPERWLEAALETHLRVVRQAVDAQRRLILLAAETIAACLTQGGKVLLFGNGGSAADAQHFAAEFVNRFRFDRPPAAAVALTTDGSVVTSIANDSRFEQVFARQVLALGRPGDVAWAFSTSGESPNVLAGIAAARERGLRTIALTGRGGRLARAGADIVLRVESTDPPRVQEAHQLLGHLICGLAEERLFGAAAEAFGSPPPTSTRERPGSP